MYKRQSDGSAKIEIILKSQKQVFVELFNVLGKSITVKDFDLNKGLNSITLDDIYPNIPTGNYVINITTNTDKISKNIIIVD